MRKYISAVSALGLLLIGAAGVPALSLAQTTTTTASGTLSADLQAKLDLIASLMKKIQTLQQQIQSLRAQQASTTVQLITALRFGSQGEQVKVLQALLAADPGIYPEGLITGFFGRATEKAVQRFQKEKGIEQAGLVGPKTLQKLNEFLKEHPLSFSGSSTCAMVPPGHLIAPGWLRKHDGERPIVPACQTLPPGIGKHLENEDDDEDQGGTSTSTTSTAPIISGLAFSAGTSTASISWTTNVGATTQVFYGLTSAYGSSTAVNTALNLSHSQTLSGLAPGTVYHFQAASIGGTSLTATSSDQTFTTSPVDVTAPTISGIAVSAASTSALLSWTTNEAANGTVFYSTSTPVNIASTSTPSVGTTTLGTSHAFTLSGLSASTTYFYLVQSADAANNTATSSQQSFVTTQ